MCSYADRQTWKHARFFRVGCT